ncbi:M28 family peptidase [Mycoplasma zalophi]|uniref:M28 family peptidase n=1 Tax=Mycoplasma zalophi TaxID=191287 RepID=UPI0021C9B4CB|nr:M28 family peptidase [Mycoplasma zalophi]MCU4117228.1 M28 family peptidase [Mycoplasma zalophi]
MKKKVKILLSLAALTPLMTVPVVAASCDNNTNKTNTENKQDTEITNNYMKYETTKQFRDFLEGTHGRKAGNIYNFQEDSLRKETVQAWLYDRETKKFGAKDQEAITGFKLEDNQSLTSEIFKPRFSINSEADKNVDIYGSWRAYEYLAKTISDMGYTNHTGNVITYPDQNVRSDTNKGTKWNAAEHTHQDGAVTTFKNEDKYADLVTKMNEDITKDGFIVQGFLYNNQSKSINNIGNNIIVTINPTQETLKANENKTKQIKDFYIVSHYDSINNVGPTGISWGATDNGSGVSVNLSLLKHFSDVKNREPLAVRLHIIFVDAEELGKYGSIAFVNQFLTPNREGTDLLRNSVGMINMDTVAGGDRMYVHSADSRETNANTATTIRDQINALSRIRSLNLNDPSQELEIHPQFTAGEYKPGETGDWSDHAPFYQKANLPIAYIESTNFAVKAKTGSYDGYAQTTNPKAWIKKSDHKPIESLVPRFLNNGLIEVYDWPEGMKKNDFEIAGDIWHSDLDRLDWVDKNLGAKFYNQLDTVYQTLVAYLTSMYESNDDGIEYFI